MAFRGFAEGFWRGVRRLPACQYVFSELEAYRNVHDSNICYVIRGGYLEPRIGSHYGSFGFGYGVYCLPKAAKPSAMGVYRFTMEAAPVASRR